MNIKQFLKPDKRKIVAFVLIIIGFLLPLFLYDSFCISWGSDICNIVGAFRLLSWIFNPFFGQSLFFPVMFGFVESWILSLVYWYLLACFLIRFSKLNWILLIGLILLFCSYIFAIGFGIPFSFGTENIIIYVIGSFLICFAIYKITKKKVLWTTLSCIILFIILVDFLYATSTYVNHFKTPLDIYTAINEGCDKLEKSGCLETDLSSITISQDLNGDGKINATDNMLYLCNNFLGPRDSPNDCKAYTCNCPLNKGLSFRIWNETYTGENKVKIWVKNLGTVDIDLTKASVYLSRAPAPKYGEEEEFNKAGRLNQNIIETSGNLISGYIGTIIISNNTEACKRVVNLTIENGLSDELTLCSCAGQELC